MRRALEAATKEKEKHTIENESVICYKLLF